MTVFQVTNKHQSWYGESIGILILEAAYPCLPGNVGNASTFPFPVRYEEVQGASIHRLLNQRDPGLVAPFIQAARRLEGRGVKAITGACGFMALFQREVAASVGIPVFLSSLLQVPFLFRITGGKPVGIITANAGCLTPDHFESVGVTPDIKFFVAGMEGQKEFREAILEEKGTLDSDRIEREAVQVASDLVARHPETGGILLECSDLPPYAHAIQAITKRPVFDFVTMIEYVHRTLIRAPYTGFM
ncbi:MAG: aspartate/glutamate racemase family protein [Thermodesulfobacteriota bacterium]